MKAQIVYKKDDDVTIHWSSKKGFGELIFKHTGQGNFKVDTECMNFNHIVEVLQAIEDPDEVEPCGNHDPDDMCDHCDCWKHTRAMCS